MRLLVSVRDPKEAAAAIAGGADIIDAKDPATGALGPVTPQALVAIRSVVPDLMPFSAALGDVRGESDIETAFGWIRVRLTWVKVGFPGVVDSHGWPDGKKMAQLVKRVVTRAETLPGHPGVIAVGYAKRGRLELPDPEFIAEVASDCGCRGVLLDTMDKSAGNLAQQSKPGHILRVGSILRREEMLLALGGSLGCGEVAWAREAGADIMGVRGAACSGGRNGRVTSARVRDLAEEFQKQRKAAL